MTPKTIIGTVLALAALAAVAIAAYYWQQQATSNT